uniref:Reverse transcriptase domain-containing protein n=1 Tax=Syphacia muris TaxID=451379 RepID=A0A0N5AG89_9BILA
MVDDSKALKQIMKEIQRSPEAQKLILEAQAPKNTEVKGKSGPSVGKSNPSNKSRVTSSRKNAIRGRTVPQEYEDDISHCSLKLNELVKGSPLKGYIQSGEEWRSEIWLHNGSSFI